MCANRYSLVCIAYIFHFIYPFNQQSLHRYVCINYRKIKIYSPIMHICMHAPCIPGKLLTTEKEEEEEKRLEKVMAYSAILMCIIVKKKSYASYVRA